MYFNACSLCTLHVTYRMTLDGSDFRVPPWCLSACGTQAPDLASGRGALSHGVASSGQSCIFGNSASLSGVGRCRLLAGSALQPVALARAVLAWVSSVSWAGWTLCMCMYLCACVCMSMHVYAWQAYAYTCICRICVLCVCMHVYLQAQCRGAFRQRAPCDDPGLLPRQQCPFALLGRHRYSAEGVRALLGTRTPLQCAASAIGGRGSLYL